MWFAVYLSLHLISWLVITEYATAQELERSDRELLRDMKTDGLSSAIGLGGEHELTRLEARRIARKAGVVDFDATTRRGSHVVVDGVDGNGDAITVLIDRRSGRIADIQR